MTQTRGAQADRGQVHGEQDTQLIEMYQLKDPLTRIFEHNVFPDDYVLAARVPAVDAEDAFAATNDPNRPDWTTLPGAQLLLPRVSGLQSGGVVRTADGVYALCLIDGWETLHPDMFPVTVNSWTGTRTDPDD